MNTYCVIGTITCHRHGVVPADQPINEHVDAPDIVAAIDSFRTDGWVFRGRVSAQLVKAKARQLRLI